MNKLNHLDWGYTLKLLLFFICLIFSVSCKQKDKRPYNPNQFEKELKANIVELNRYAKAHTAFASYEVEMDEANYIKYDLLPKELMSKYDVKFYGDAGRFLVALSKYCNFMFDVKGTKSSSSNNIYIKHKDAKLVDILSDVGAQLSNDLSVDVDVDVVNETFTVKLIYPHN